MRILFRAEGPEIFIRERVPVFRREIGKSGRPENRWCEEEQEYDEGSGRDENRKNQKFLIPEDDIQGAFE